MEKSSVRTSILPLSLIRAGEDLREADDRVERGPQFVAHGRQEVALEPVHLEEGHVGLRQLVDLAIQVVVHVAELLLHGHQVVEHPVEGVRELLELVAGLDLAADREPAGGDRVGDIAEVLDRLDDHVADDHVRRDHRQHRGDQREGDQHGAITVDRLGGLLHRQADHDGSGQVVGLGVHPVLAVGRQLHHVVVDVFEGGLPGAVIDRVAVHQAARLEEDRLDVMVFLDEVVVLLLLGDQLGPSRRAVGEGVQQFGGMAWLARGGRPDEAVEIPTLEVVPRLLLGVGGFLGVEHPGVMLGDVAQRLEVVDQDVEDRLPVVVPQRLVVHVQQRGPDEHACRLGRLLPHQALGLLAVPEEAGRDQDEDAQAEDEAALPLQAGLAEQVFEAAIGHEPRFLDRSVWGS
jgi:hypothetical protein